MWANRIVDFLVGLTAFVVVPVQLVTTFLTGCLASLTLGLALLPFSLIWLCLLGPLLGLSWLWAKAPLLRIPTAIVGIPLAVLANDYTALITSMGETDARVSKLVICQTWPFSREFMAYQTGKAGLTSDLEEVLARLASRDPNIGKFLANRQTA